MQPMTYARPDNATEAVEMLSQPGAAVLAGGTTLVDLMRCKIVRPTTLIDISRLQDLRAIEDSDGSIAIGACATMTEVARNRLVGENFPAIREALLQAASAQIRNQATVGGNLLQGPRCVFYRDHRAPCSRRDHRQPCSARMASTITPPLVGAHQKCMATYPGDLAVALAAYEATVEVQSQSGARQVGVTDLLRPPDPADRPALEAGALITRIFVPEFSSFSAFVKRRQRASFAFASASAAAALEVADHTVVSARIAIGAQSTHPHRMTGAEQVLIGKPLQRSSFEAAAAAVVAGLNGPDHAVAWCRDTVTQALTEAAARAAHAVR